MNDLFKITTYKTFDNIPWPDIYEKYYYVKIYPVIYYLSF